MTNVFSIEVPGGSTFKFDLDQVPTEQTDYIMNGLLEYALNVIAQRALAGKGELTDAAKAALVRDKLQRLQDGSYVFGTGTREGDPVAMELRAMADEAARSAKWQLTACRSVAKEHGPLVAYALAMLIAAGKCTAGTPDYAAAKRVAARNEEALLAKARANIAARTVDIVL